jgi:Fe-S oxidoreductase
LKQLSNRWAGIAPRRTIPNFARQPFTRWFEKRTRADNANRKVLLWPDTFNNFFHPESAIAATRVLEAAGYSVVIPRQPLCCGRPLYDFGMLDQAKEQLAEIMRALEPEIRTGVPIVGLEPACVSVFKDELLNLFPDDALARTLSAQVVYLSDFLLQGAGLVPIPHNWRALVHGHCHHKAVIGMGAETAVLERLGVQAKLIESGCCGMAGSFGFRPETYELSVQAAELNLLPAVRAVAADELIVASGYSCREQIDQLSRHKAVHVAEAAALALGLSAPETSARGGP